jgi:hypothetical protein
MVESATAPLALSPELEELYRGHKVVALPSRGRLTVREHVSTFRGSNARPRSLSAGRSRIRPHDLVQDIYDRMGVSFTRGGSRGTNASNNTNNVNANTGKEPSSPTKPANTNQFSGKADTINNNNNAVFFPENSLNEANTITNDKVNNSTRPSIPRKSEPLTKHEKFADRYRFAAALSRGRTMEGQTPSESGSEPTRARSLSRGRVAQIWPPSSGNEAETPTANNVTNVSSLTQANMASPTRNTAAAVATSSPRFLQTRPVDKNGISSSVSPTRSFDLRVNRGVVHSNSFDVRLTTTAVKRDKELKVEDVDPSDDIPEPPPSVKDRISVYGVAKNAVVPPSRKKVPRNIESSYAAQFAARDHPPKIDIYSEANQQQSKAEEEKKEEYVDPGEKMPLSPTHSAGTSASKLRRNEGGASKVSTSSKSNMADAFLAKIQSSNANSNNNLNLAPRKTILAQSTPMVNSAPPVMEIVKDNNYDRDDVSVEMSTISGDEFTQKGYHYNTTITTNHKVLKENKKLAPWQTRDRVAAYNTSPSPYTSTPGKNNTAQSSHTSTPMDSQSIAKMIDDRVQVAVAEAEARMEIQFQKKLQTMSEQALARMAHMEARIEHLTAILQRVAPHDEL